MGGGTAAANVAILTAANPHHQGPNSPHEAYEPDTEVYWQQRDLYELAWLFPPTGDRAAEVSWAEFELPLAARRAEVSWAELEVPLGPRRAEVSWAEIEVPLAPRRGEISWAELELPLAPGSGGRHRTLMHIGS